MDAFPTGGSRPSFRYRHPIGGASGKKVPLALAAALLATLGAGCAGQPGSSSTGDGPTQGAGGRADRPAAAAGDTPAVPAGKALVPVAVRLPFATSIDIADARRVPVMLRMKRAGTVRLSAVLRFGGAAAGAKLGPTRPVKLPAKRWTTARIPLSATSRSALWRCPGGRIDVTVASARLGRPRTVGRNVRVGPPACGRFFGPAAVWNRPLAADAQLDPDSDAVTRDLLKKVDAGRRNDLPPTIATDAYAPPVYTVPVTQPRVRVQLDPGDDRSLAAAFESVPLPSKATPAPGSDHELVVWQPSTDTLWEFWRLRRAHGGWHARWGGRLDHVYTGPGHYTAPHASWGTTASSLPLVGGMITPRELAAGHIDHALAVAVPHTRASAFSRPAQRTDGDSACAHAVPEGARFRLDPSLDIDSLALPRAIAIIARAAQQYGIYVRDQSDSVTFYAQSTVSLPSDPYPALFGGYEPYVLLERFPWSHLQLLKMQLVDSGRGSPLGGLLQGCGQ
jgi:hypothetical protein